MANAQLSEIEEVRAVLAVWALWARRRVGPHGFADESIEYLLQTFHCMPPTSIGLRLEPEHKLAQTVEGIIVGMPAHLKKYILVEFISGGSPKARARQVHNSVPKYYNELQSALWWLHSNAKFKSFL
jgi:hypothetical protein